MYCSFSKKQEEYKLEDGEDVIPQVSKFKFKFKYLGSINEKLWENEWGCFTRDTSKTAKMQKGNWGSLWMLLGNFQTAQHHHFNLICIGANVGIL